jgi:very-short-patch-repair endonuclease
MGAKIFHSSVWALVRRQHGVVSRAQLLALGLSAKAIRHRLENGRLHGVWPGVYAVGRPELTRYGRWMAAVLASGPDAVLSHQSAAELWEIRQPRGGPIQLSVPTHIRRNRPGLTLFRRAVVPRTHRHGIPTTPPAQTLIDLAAALEDQSALEAAINEADKRDLIHPKQLHQAAQASRARGAKRLRDLLDRQTLTLTDTELERRFLPIARNAGLPPPKTQAWVNGHRVDFHWPDLGLVVETDGGRYHRTPAQQTADRKRDQTHLATGLTPLRFTHAQIRYEPTEVQTILVAVVQRLRSKAGSNSSATIRSTVSGRQG